MLAKLKAAGSGSAPPTLPGSVDRVPGSRPSRTRGAAPARRTPASACSNTMNGAPTASISTPRLFLYKTTRNLLNRWDTEPIRAARWRRSCSSACHPRAVSALRCRQVRRRAERLLYAPGSNYQAPLVPPARSASGTLEGQPADPDQDHHLAAGLPAFFGFTVYSSLHPGQRTTRARYRSRLAPTVGGRSPSWSPAMTAVSSVTPIQVSRRPGAADPHLGQRSWARAGYGWLPTNTCSKGLAVDCGA